MANHRLLILLAILVLMVVPGCGGGGGGTGDGGPVAPAQGSIGFTVEWPDPPAQVDPAMIPSMSNCIKLELWRVDAQAPERTEMLVRPNTSLRIDDLQTGPVMVNASAYPQDDATGVMQAHAEMQLAVEANGYTERVLSLDSTIVDIEIAPQPASVRVGERLQLTATARDSEGRIVLVPDYMGFDWSVDSGQDCVVLDGNGGLTGEAPGTVTLRATETESAVSGTASVEVISLGTVLSGTVTDTDGLPIYGATVSAPDEEPATGLGIRTVATGVTTETDRDGHFELSISRISGSAQLLVTAPGYGDNSLAVPLGQPHCVVPSMELTSFNAARLRAMAAPSTEHEIRTCFEGLELAVGSDPNGRDLSDCHIAAVKTLLDQDYGATIAGIASELAIQGLQIDGAPLSPEALANVLQAFVNVAYQRPNDPRMIIGQYLVADASGALPVSPPTITPATILDPAKSTVLFEALYLAVSNPRYAAVAASARVHPAGLWNDVAALGRSIAESLVNAPTGGDIFADGAEGYVAQGQMYGAMSGIALCGGVAGLLSATGVGVVAIPYLVNPTTLAVASGVGSFIGGRVAMWLYKNQNNQPSDPDPALPRPGDPVTEQHASEIAMNLSGWVVPRGSLGWQPPEDGDFVFYVTMTWNEGTSDADLHTWAPDTSQHSFYGNKMITGGQLDRDDTEGFGPEHFTATEIQPGRWRIAVNSYDLDEATSYATTVRVITGGLAANSLSRTYGPHTFTTDNGQGYPVQPPNWWRPVDIIVANDGTVSVASPDSTVLPSNLFPASEPLK